MVSQEQQEKVLEENAEFNRQVASAPHKDESSEQIEVHSLGNKGHSVLPVGRKLTAIL